MTVQVDSQPVTDQIMWYIDMCCIDNSISCLEKKTTFRTHEQTCYVDFDVGLPSPPPFGISAVYPSKANWLTFSHTCFDGGGLVILAIIVSNFLLYIILQRSLIR